MGAYLTAKQGHSRTGLDGTALKDTEASCIFQGLVKEAVMVKLPAVW